MEIARRIKTITGLRGTVRYLFSWNINPISYSLLLILFETIIYLPYLCHTFSFFDMHFQTIFWNKLQRDGSSILPFDTYLLLFPMQSESS